MKKIALTLMLCLLFLSAAALPIFAAGADTLAFPEESWSAEQPYPDWYGGRYWENTRVVYVIVAGHEAQAALLPDDAYFVVKPHSYNALMTVLEEVGRDRLGKPSVDETPYVYSAGIDESRNCVPIQLYVEAEQMDAKKDKVEALSNALHARYGTMVSVSVTNELVSYVTVLSPLPQNPLQQASFWLFAAFALLSISLVFLFLRKQTADRKALQLADGGADGRVLRRAEAVYAIRSASLSPADSVLERILADIS